MIFLSSRRDGCNVLGFSGDLLLVVVVVACGFIGRLEWILLIGREEEGGMDESDEK